MLEPRALPRTARTGPFGRLAALIFNRPLEGWRHLRRPGDMAVADFTFTNMTLETGKGFRRLKPARPWEPSLMAVLLGPQHVGESVWKTAGAEKLPIVDSRIAGFSTLVFRRPADAPPTPFTAEALLQACAEWPLVLSPNAAPTGEPSYVMSLAELADSHGLTVSDAVLAEVARDIDGSAARIAALVRAQAHARRPETARFLRRWRTEADRAVARALQRLGTADPHAGGVARAHFQQAVFDRSGEALAQLDGKGLLDIGGLAAAEPPGMPREPSMVTALELPWRVILSPTANGRFLSRTEPFAVNGRSELWHMRLVRGASAVPGGEAESVRDPPAVRAIWSPDWPGALGLDGEALEQPFTTGLNPRDRAELVARTADFTQTDLETGGPYKPAPALARRLELSALGGSLDAEARWKGLPGKVRLEAWKHRAALGRDSRVVVVRAGFLYPFGHRCSITDVTEREIVNWQQEFAPGLGPSEPFAVLVKRSYISVGERVKSYAAGDLPHQGRAFPFEEVEVLTGVTQIEDAPGDSKGWYWPTKPGESAPMDFELRVRDHAGRVSGLRMPLMFTYVDKGVDAAEGEAIHATYVAGKAPRTAGLHGARVRLAAADGAADSLSFPVDSVTFDADPLAAASGLGGGLHRFRPRLGSAVVEAPGSAEFAGGAQAVEVGWSKTYLDHAFSAAENPGEVALELGKPLPLFAPGKGGSSEKAGGLATPRLAVHGFSRKLGAVTGPDAPSVSTEALGAVAKGGIDYATLLPDMKLFGVFPIKDLLEAPPAGPGNVEVSLGKGLSLKAEETPDAHVASLTLKQTMKAVGAGVVLTPGPGSAFSIDARTVTPKAGKGEARQSVTAALDAFSIAFFNVVSLNFQKLAFVAEPGKKPDLVLEFTDHPLTFTGDLAFLQKLADALPSSAFTDPPDLQVTPEGVLAGYSLGLPPIAVGAASLTNIAFGAAFRLPFLGDRPSLRLNFAERDAPFGVLVSLLGGGGFFAMELDTGGVRMIEGTVEAQAGIVINLGVAAGAVTARLGIYYRWLKSGTGESVTLEAFAELRGELSVLGLISASITFHVGLGILKQEGRVDLVGTATVTVEVEVLFFSKSVGIECRREFQGSDGDPTFADVFPAPALPELDPRGDKAWTEYAGAFA